MIGKIRLISKSITSQPGEQAIAIYTFTNISLSKRNQAVEFGQLIEYNMRKFFLQDHTQNVVEKLFPGPFLEIKIEHISGSIF